MLHASRRAALALFAAGCASLVLVSSASAHRFVVLLKPGKTHAGLVAVAQSGGKVVAFNRYIGMATVSAPEGFGKKLRATHAVTGVALDAAWNQPELKLVKPKPRSVVIRYTAAAGVRNPPPVDQATTEAGCSVQYSNPTPGPEPLSVCQWDMRLINATTAGSYAVNPGQGALIGDIDTGADVSHPDIAPNLNLALSCSFIAPGTPTSLPQEWEADQVNCPTKSAVQDYNGHGTHTASTMTAPINGIGIAGVAPKATLVALHAGTADGGFFFTDSVVNALTYAGVHHLDAVNMSFFADPFLYNCHGAAQQQTIIQALSRAAQFAHNQGVVLVASAGNEASDLDHPPAQDEISPDYPPDAATPRDISNNCSVIPAELPWVVTVSAIGPRKLISFYSNISNSKVDVTAPGGSSNQAPNPYGRVLAAWSETAPVVNPNAQREVEDCETVGGAPVCGLYGWIQGTSMASPHVTGVVALIRSTHPGMPPGAVEALLQGTAQPMSCPTEAERAAFLTPAGFDLSCTGGGQTSFYGNGLVDALAAGKK
jgi:lantibiotic leader peptide-processing serine protease